MKWNRCSRCSFLLVWSGNFRSGFSFCCLIEWERDRVWVLQNQPRTVCSLLTLCHRVPACFRHFHHHSRIIFEVLVNASSPIFWIVCTRVLLLVLSSLTLAVLHRAFHSSQRSTFSGVSMNNAIAYIRWPTMKNYAIAVAIDRLWTSRQKERTKTQEDLLNCGILSTLSTTSPIFSLFYQISPVTIGQVSNIVSYGSAYFSCSHCAQPTHSKEEKDGIYKCKNDLPDGVLLWLNSQNLQIPSENEWNWNAGESSK